MTNDPFQVGVVQEITTKGKSCRMRKLRDVETTTIAAAPAKPVRAVARS